MLKFSFHRSLHLLLQFCSLLYFNHSSAQCSFYIACETMWDWTTPLKPGWANTCLVFTVVAGIRTQYEKSEDSTISGGHVVTTLDAMYLACEIQPSVQLEVWCLQKSPSIPQSLYHNRPKNSEVQSLHKQHHNSYYWSFFLFNGKNKISLRKKWRNIKQSTWTRKHNPKKKV